MVVSSFVRLLCLIASYGVLVLIIVLLLFQVSSDVSDCNDYFKPQLNDCLARCGSGINVSLPLGGGFEPIVVAS